MTTKHHKEGEKAEGKKFNLNYEIVGRRRLSGDNPKGLECVDVVWKAKGLKHQHTELVPVNHPPRGPGGPPIEYRETPVGDPVEEIKDCITCEAGTLDHMIMAQLEAKRERLAETLGIEP